MVIFSKINKSLVIFIQLLAIFNVNMEEVKYIPGNEDIISFVVNGMRGEIFPL